MAYAMAKGNLLISMSAYFTKGDIKMTWSMAQGLSIGLITALFITKVRGSPDYWTATSSSEVFAATKDGMACAKMVNS
jgi:hypothetical protein